jgi:hypothetical protein
MANFKSKYAKHLKAVDGSMDGFADIMEGIMNDVLKKIDGYSKQFLRAGELMTSEVLEAVQANQIRQDIIEMLRESGFDDAVDLYVNNWDELSIDGLSDVMDAADIPLSFTSVDLDLMSQLQSFNIEKALSIENALAQNLQSSIANMALGGASWSDTIPELRKRVDIDVNQHLKTQLNTGLSVFDRKISEQKLDMAGVTTYRYYGPSDAVTRDFCKWVLNQQSKSSFDGWTKAEIEGMSSRSDWKKGSGGLGDVFTACGGWNCRHVFGVWIPDEIEKIGVVDEGHVEFVAAENVFEAEAFARKAKIAKKVDYKKLKDVSVANDVNRTLLDFKNKYNLAVDEIITGNRANRRDLSVPMRHEAKYDLDGNLEGRKLFINNAAIELEKDYATKKGLGGDPLQAFMKETFDEGWWIAESTADMVAHEFGHFLTATKTIKEAKDLDVMMKFLGVSISGTGRVNGWEALAEIFSAYNKGDKLKPEWVEFFNKYSKEVKIK